MKTPIKHAIRSTACRRGAGLAPIFALCFALPLTTAQAQTSTSHVFPGAGGVTHGGGYTNTCSIAQPGDIGHSAGGGYRNFAGFLAPHFGTDALHTDLVVSKSIDDDARIEEDVATYTIVVSNAGPYSATEVVITDALPPGLSYIADDGGGAYDDATDAWSVGVLLRGASTSLTMTATIDPGTEGTFLTNIASVAHDLPDDAPIDNTDTVTLSVVPRQMAVYGNGHFIEDNDTVPSALDGTDFGTVPMPWRGSPRMPGTQPSAIVTVPEPPYDGVDWVNAQNVAISDNSHARITLPVASNSFVLSTTDLGFAIPAGSTILGCHLIYERGRSSSTPIRDSLVQLVVGGIRQGENRSEGATWNYGSDQSVFFGGAHDTWGLNLDVDDVNAPGFGVAVAAVATDEGSPSPGVGWLDRILLVVYYDTPGEHEFLRVQTFAITNVGTGLLQLDGAPTVSIEGTNPGDFRITSAPDTNIVGGAHTTVSIGFCPAAEGVRSASVRIGSSDSEQNPYNFGITGVGRQLQVSPEITQIIDDSIPEPGQLVTYTVMVTNHGPDMVTTLRARDALPSGVTFDSASASQGAYDEPASQWTVGTLPAGAIATLDLRATVDPLPIGSVIVNSALILSMDQVDLNYGDNMASATFALDTDGDDLSDVIEIAHGLNPENDADATEDTDQDGVSNMDEILRYGSDLRDPGDAIARGASMRLTASAFDAGGGVASNATGTIRLLSAFAVPTPLGSNAATANVICSIQQGFVKCTVSDLDGDGVPDALDDDIDGDGILNRDETGAAARDSDGDGIPNWLDDDSDNDGHSDLEELISGTSMFSAGSMFEVAIQVDEVASGINVSWQSVVGRLYVILYTQVDLLEATEADWQVLTTAIGDGQMMTLEDSGAGYDMRFYRVKVSMPPP